MTDVDIQIIPIPDSRSELPNESVIVTVAAAGEYAVGSPSSQTLNITDDDTVNLPSSGYKLTDLGNVSSAGSSYAYGINTEPDGQGGWRGRVVGNALFTSGYYAQTGFQYDNGALSLRYPPTGSPFNGGANYASAYALNDASTIVGQAMNYTSGSYQGWACYWPVNTSYATLLGGLYSPNLNNLAQDINQRDAVNNRGGLIVGQSVRTDGKTHAVVWIPNTSGVYGGAVDLADLGDGITLRNSYATALNYYADVVGRSQIITGNNYHGFLTRSLQNPNSNNQWEPLSLDSNSDDQGTATMTDAHTSEFNDVNDLSEIVGRGNVVGTTHLRGLYKAPFSTKDHGYYNLKVLGHGTADAGTESVAYGISANGVIVGMSRLKVGGSQVWRAFVLSNVGNPGSQNPMNLNDNTSLFVNGQWVTAASQGWTLVSAERINRVGWIAGYGTKNGQTRAFVLSPR